MEGLCIQRSFLQMDPHWLERDLLGSRTDPSEFTIKEACHYVNTVRRASKKQLLKKDKYAVDYFNVANNNFSRTHILQRAAAENFLDFPVWANCVRSPGMQWIMQ